MNGKNKKKNKKNKSNKNSWCSFSICIPTSTNQTNNKKSKY
jgi:hypothetical protein